MKRRNLSITAYKKDFGEGDGARWFGGVYEGPHPVADSAQLGSEGTFNSRDEAIEWARDKKGSILGLD